MLPMSLPAVARSAWSQHPPLTLLVDRDADTRKMYAEFLKLAPCEIDEAEDGREALAKAISRHPDLVVTETRLPGMNGFELCAVLRSDASTSDIPIVFVTGDAYATDVRRAQQAGADSVLIKPCMPETLLNEMRRLLDTSADLRARGRALSGKVREQLDRSERLLKQSREQVRRQTLSRAHLRGQTTDPPNPPPALVCPVCDQALRYARSHVGGVNARLLEQWDYYECAAGCGTFQYRQRTRRLRPVT